MAVLTELVEHFVVLMLENRSYDLMLGGLRHPKYEVHVENLLAPASGEANEGGAA